ncbi:hypothetical protein ACFPFX_38385 [Streptomyces mauvecolor]|uniref:Uncharacterized protein n=1 Tax=Streptomyces mauvecolor TaxID=58345 RepID=A0ABV9V0N8_9ACTN
MTQNVPACPTVYVSRKKQRFVQDALMHRKYAQPGMDETLFEVTDATEIKVIVGDRLLRLF